MDANWDRYRTRSLFFLLTFLYHRFNVGILLVVIVKRGYDFRRKADTKRRVRHGRTHVQSRKRHVYRHANVLADVSPVVDDLCELHRGRLGRPGAFD